MAKGSTDRLGAVVDVSFVDGGHMLAWIQALRRALRLVEQLLVGARAEVAASLSHQRWRWLRGDGRERVPPRVRAIAVTVHLSMQIAAVRSALRSIDWFEPLLNGMIIEPAQRAAEEQRRQFGGEG